MALGIKSDHLSFEILPSSDARILIFLDTSEYKEEPERPLLEVTLPGHAKYTLVNIVARKINTLNSNLVGYSKLIGVSYPTALPDGVYTLKYKICPYDLVYHQKYYLRTTQLQARVHQIRHFLEFSDCRVTNEEQLKKDVIDLSLLMDKGESEAWLGNSREASEAYQKALKKATTLLEKLNKHCV